LERELNASERPGARRKSEKRTRERSKKPFGGEINLAHLQLWKRGQKVSGYKIWGKKLGPIICALFPKTQGNSRQKFIEPMRLLNHEEEKTLLL